MVDFAANANSLLSDGAYYGWDGALLSANLQRLIGVGAVPEAVVVRLSALVSLQKVLP
jgi:hypothetical protein